jgi:hypothetical protein
MSRTAARAGNQIGKGGLSAASLHEGHDRGVHLVQDLQQADASLRLGWQAGTLQRARRRRRGRLERFATQVERAARKREKRAEVILMNADQLDIKEIGKDKYTLEFPYNPDFIDFIKHKVASRDREYDPDTKVWTVRGKQYVNYLQGVGLQKFAHVMFIYRKDGRQYRVLWSCNCDCGTKGKIVSGADLRYGGVRSCGCLYRFHGHAAGNGSREYRIWTDMLQRCKNPKMKSFRYYGERGISVCERWNVFANFISDMGLCPPNYSLDRIDNDGNYEPGNCRWATLETQRKNRRKTGTLSSFSLAELVAEIHRRTKEDVA